MIIQFACIGAVEDIQCRLFQLFVGNSRIHSTHFKCCICAVFSATRNPLNGVIGTYQARQAHAATPTRQNAQLGFWQANFGLLAHHAEIGGQQHFATAAQRQPVDRRHGGERQVLNRIEDVVNLEVHLHQILFALVEQAVKFGDVGADDKGVFATAYHQPFQTTFGLNRFYRIAQLCHNGAG